MPDTKLARRRSSINGDAMPPPASSAGNKWWPKVRNFLAGYSSGVCLVLAGHPFDTIKVRLQNEGTKVGRFSGLGDCLRQTLRHEGVRGFYKGMGAPLVTTGVINCVLFGTQYSLVQSVVARRLGGSDACAASCEECCEEQSARRPECGREHRGRCGRVRSYR